MFNKKMTGGKNNSRNSLVKRRPKLKELLLASVTAGLLAAAAREAHADLTWYTLDSTMSTVQKIGISDVTLGNYTLTTPSALEPGANQYDWTAVTFTAVESGNFYFGQTYSPVDTIMIFYNGVFDPSRPGYGAIIGNDDTSAVAHQALVGPGDVVCGPSVEFCPQVKADIVQGQTYTLFISVFHPLTYRLDLPLTFYSTASVAFGPYTGRHPIDLSAPFHLSSQLGVTVDPDFVGGTLKMDEEGHTYGQNFTVAHIDSSTIEMDGKNTVFTGAFSDAATSPQGHITFKDSVGGGSVTFGGVNTYTGTTTLASGLVKAGATDVFATSSQVSIASGARFDMGGHNQSVNQLTGSGTIGLGSGTLTTNGAVDYSGLITGSGNLVVNAGGKLYGASDYSGGTSVRNGTLQAYHSAALGAGSVTVDTPAVLELNTSSGNLSVGNAVNGGGALNTSGSGTITLTASNTSIGTVNVGGGGLVLAQSGAFNANAVSTASGSALKINNTAQLNVSGLFRQNAPDAILTVEMNGRTGAAVNADTASLGGVLNITGLSANAAAARASDVMSSQKTVIHTANGISGDFASVNLGGAGSTVDYLALSTGKSTDGKDYNVGFGLSWFTGSPTGHGTFTVAGASDSFDIDVALSDQPAVSATGWDGKSLTKKGAGTLILSAGNDYTGSTYIQGGTLKTGITDAFASSEEVIIWSGAKLDLNGFDQTAARLAGAGAIDLGSAALTINVPGFDIYPPEVPEYIFSGVISGAGRLVKTGEGDSVLSGNNTYSGGTAIREGTLRIDNGNALGTGEVAMDFLSRLLINFSRDAILANRISGTGDLQKFGNGAAILTAAGSSAGLVSAERGTLIFAQNGVFTADEYFTASNAATTINGSARLIVNNGIMQAENSTLNIDAGRTDAAITATTASLDGTLNVTGFSGNSTAAKASELLSNGVTVIHTTGGISGDFASVNLGGAGSAVDYLILSAGKSADGKDYNVGFGLTWLAGPTTGDGVFTLASSTDAFDVDVVLADQAESATGWDGKTLTKAGAGTLTLSSVNTYTGITDIREGVLKTGVSNAVAESAGIDISAGAVFDLNGYDQQVTILYGQGTAKLGSNDLTIKIDPNRLPIAIPHPGAGPIPIYYYGQITGTGAVTIENDSNSTIYTLTGNSDYSGGTRILTGTVALTNGNALGTGAVTNDAALQLNFATNGVFANTLSGTGSLAKKGTGTATLTGAGSRAGAVSVDAGTLLFGQNGAFYAASLSTASGATTGFTGDSTLVLGGALIQDAGSTLSIAAGSAQPVITATTATLGGTLSVSGYAGTATAKASTLTGTLFQVIHTTGGITGDFATVDLGGAGSSTDYLTIAGAKSPDGKDYNVGFGLTWLAGTTTGSGKYTLANSADAFDVDVILADQASSATGWDGKTLTKAGAGTLTLSSVNTYTGPTYIEAGTLKMGTDNAISSSYMVNLASGATLDLNGHDLATGYLFGAGDINLRSGALTIRQGDIAMPGWIPGHELSGVISGTGSLTLAGGMGGSLTLSGNNTYSGGTRIVNAMLTATNGDALGSGAVAIEAAGSTVATLKLDFASNGTLANVLSGGGNLVKSGSGAAVLTGSGSSIGDVSVDAGALLFGQSGAFGAGSLNTASGATVGFNGEAALVLSGALVQEAGSALSIVAGTAQPVVTATTATLDGTLSVSGYAAGSAPARASALTGSRFQVIHTTGGISDDFDAVSFGLRGSPGTDYLTLAGWKSEDGKDYSVGFGLTWLTGVGNAHGMFNLASAAETFEIDLPLSDRTETMASGWDGKSLVKMGDGTLILSAANTFSGGMTLAGGTVQVSSNANLGAETGKLTFDGGTLETTASFTSARAMELAGGGGTLKTADGTVLVLTGAIGGTGGLTTKGRGTLALDGPASYLGGTLIDEGRLETRRANVLSASSGHTVSSGAALVLNGHDQTVASLSNAGEVRIGALDGSRAGATLTVTGAYVSNGGSLLLNTVLGSDNSVTDRLVAGSVEMAGAATTIFITNAGGLGDYTNANGIAVVQVGDASQSAADAFVLGGRVAAGAYDYHLFQGGVGSDAGDGNWYLRNQRPEEPAAPDIRPEVPLVMAIPPLAIEYGYALLDTRHQRFAETAIQQAQPAYEERTVRCKDASQNYRCVTRTPVAAPVVNGPAYGAWARIFGTRGTQEKNNFLRHGPDFDYTFGGGQVGFDLYARDHADGRLDRAGVYVSYGQISSKVKDVRGGKAGTVDMDAYSVAGYWTHQSPEGWYTDAVVQGTWYSADAKSVLGQQVKPDGFGVAVSAEGGYAFNLGGGLSVEPQAQLVYQAVSFDDVRDSYGFASFDRGDSLRGRVGARLARRWDVGEGGNPRQITGWIRANLWHEFLGDGKTLVTDLNGANPARFGSPLRGTWAEIGAGVSGQVTDSTTLFLNGAYNRSVDNKGRETWDGRVGVNVKW